VNSASHVTHSLCAIMSRLEALVPHIFVSFYAMDIFMFLILILLLVTFIQFSSRKSVGSIGGDEYSDKRHHSVSDNINNIDKLRGWYFRYLINCKFFIIALNFGTLCVETCFKRSFDNVTP
jgi:hypothetical protein